LELPAAMKILLSALLLAACAADTQKTETIVPPDSSALRQLYPTAAQQQVTAPFAVDLGACNTVASVDSANQFALTHMNADGRCEVWIGYNAETGLHADTYCVFDPYGTETVVTAAAATTDGGCGGPPGTLPLTIQSPRCVSVY
jgi:hypothetical protein